MNRPFIGSPFPTSGLYTTSQLRRGHLRPVKADVARLIEAPSTMHRFSSLTRGRYTQWSSKLEVERKFCVTPELLDFVKTAQSLQRELPDDSGGPGTLRPNAAQCPPGQTQASIEMSDDFNNLAMAFHVDAARPQDIADVYYDRDGILSDQGVWLRYRTAYDQNPPFGAKLIYAAWEAKIRQGGDYNKSQFVEVEGREVVEAELSKYISGTQLPVRSGREVEGLHVTADLTTYRHTGRLSGDVMACVCLDEVSSRGTVLGKQVYFKHLIGEIEITRSVETIGSEEEHEAAKKEAAISMSAAIDGFMERCSKLFPSQPEPVGKLSAYFARKKKHGILQLQ